MSVNLQLCERHRHDASQQNRKASPPPGLALGEPDDRLRWDTRRPEMVRKIAKIARANST
jgi:hypothetical protein